jgi:hypothetical protein
MSMHLQDLNTDSYRNVLVTPIAGAALPPPRRWIRCLDVSLRQLSYRDGVVGKEHAVIRSLNLVNLESFPFFYGMVQEYSTHPPFLTVPG